MKDFNGIKYKTSGRKKGATFLWGHGWGQDHSALADMLAPFENAGTHIAVDFPGFGASDKPDGVWGTDDYADALAGLIGDVAKGPVIWIGHSFGCRVGLRVAAAYPDLISGLFLVAGAGVPRELPFYKSVYFKARIAVFKCLKRLIPLGLSEDWLRNKFGSADYKNADPVMRDILVKTVNEDLSDIAPRVSCPVTLVYGDQDTETPPQIGEKLDAALPSSKLIVLPDQDHYSVLGGGRHQVLRHLKEFIGTITA